MRTLPPIQFQPHDTDQQRLEKLRRLAEQVASALSSVVSGAQGPAGPTGPQGPTGATGPTGPAGPAGGTLSIVGGWGISVSGSTANPIVALAASVQDSLALADSAVQPADLDPWLATKTTSDLAEGTNLYFTDERAQDAVGSIFGDTPSIDLVYDDAGGSISANIIDEYVEDLVGAMLTDTASIGLAYNDGLATITADVDVSWSPTWTANHRWTDNDEIQLGTGGDLRLYHDGTNSLIRNDTGFLEIQDTGATRFTRPGGNPTMQVLAESGRYASIRWTRSSGTTSDWELYIPETSTDLRFFRASDRIAFTNTGFVRLLADNQELQIGAGNDLRLYHDGTNSIIENDTGSLILRVGGELSLDEVGTSTTATAGTRTLPANPVDFLTVIINGTSRKIPYYAT